MKLSLVPPAARRLEQGDPTLDDLSIRIDALGGVGEHAQSRTIAPDQIERHLVKKALHAQQRGEMRLIKYPSRHGQQIEQALSQKLFVAEIEPLPQSFVDEDNAPSVIQDDVAAGGTIEQITEVGRVIHGGLDEFPDGHHDLRRRGKVGAVSRRVQHHELASGDVVPDILPDFFRSDDVVPALEDQCSRRYFRQVGAVVGRERHPGERFRYRWVSAAEAVSKLLSEFRLIGIAHNRRGHRHRPPQMLSASETSSSSMSAALNPP